MVLHCVYTSLVNDNLFTTATWTNCVPTLFESQTFLPLSSLHAMSLLGTLFHMDMIVYVWSHLTI